MKILDYKYSTEVIANYNSSKLAQSEKNDCVVRAVAAASGSSYDSAHKFVAETFGRQNGEGTFGVSLILDKIAKQPQQIGGTQVTFNTLSEQRKKNTYKLHGKVIKRDKTVKSFIKDNARGTYIVLVAKHAFVVKDGVLIDNRGEEFRPTRKVTDAFAVTAKQPEVQLSLF